MTSRDAKRDKRQEYIDHSVEVLRQAGSRITKPRLAVLECLAGMDRSLSAGDLTERIKKGRDAQRIDLATVYRNLESLSSLGLVHRVGPSGNFIACSHPGCTTELHIIAHCAHCDWTHEVDVPEAILAPVKKHILRATRFQLREHFLQINGICPNCGLAGRS
jgi:Fe2+ or Zn2+ uptake regulation protein